MKKFSYTSIFLFAFQSILTAQTFNANLSAKLQLTLDTLVADFSPNTKGVSIGIYCPGQGYWNGVSGINYVGESLTPDMKMGIASNTKLFVAVTMLRLAEDQVLSLDDSLHEWIPNYNNVDPNITIRQLLNHSSGISDPFFNNGLLDSIEANPTRDFTVPEVMAMVQAPLFPAGTSYGYSNINYLLVGSIAEAATGLSMAQLIRNYILTPLNLTNTFYDIAEAEIGTVAHRWHNNVDFNDTSRISLNTSGGPAGSLFSTALDMVQWYHALMNNQVINENSFQEMIAFINPNNLGNYGLGIKKVTYFGRETWGHGGSTLGYKSLVIYDPCSKTIVCGLANADWAAIDGITALMYKVLVDNLPDCAQTVSGSSSVCAGEQSVIYTVPVITNATSYAWTLPNGAGGVSLSNSITVDFSMAATSGDITVKGINDFGEGAPSTLSLTVNPIPPTPLITFDGTSLHSDAPIGNQWYDANGMIAGANAQDLVVQSDGIYYAVVSVNGCSSSNSNSINTSLSGVQELSDSDATSVYPNPMSANLNLKTNELGKNTRYQITNALGQIMEEGQFTDQLSVSCATYINGIYFIKLDDGQKTFIYKVRKQ